MRRVQLASSLLGADDLVIANLIPVALRSTTDQRVQSVSTRRWGEARSHIESLLDPGDIVLLGYGTTEPSAPARERFRGQVAWLHSMLCERDLRVVQVGDRPHHPSRWHRYTRRKYPNLDFPAALRIELSESTSYS